MSQDEIGAHVRGETCFVDDMDTLPGLLYAAVLGSPIAHGRIIALDTEPAAALKGVKGVFSAGDIPGENQIGGIVKDEPLLAEDVLHFVGQPLALVVAESPQQARRALAHIRLEVAELPPVLDPRVAAERGLLVSPPRCFAAGDVETVLNQCPLVVSGRVDSGGQEHLYLETQAALAVPAEKDCLRLYSATQSPSAVQRIAARILDMPMSRIVVEVYRLGGAFGGKEDQATCWAVMAALAARRLKRPVKLVLDRREDMRNTGKRHPYSSDYRLGLNRDGKILAYDVTYYQNAGAAADLSPAILERSLFHAGNSYHIPNLRARGFSCRTNLPPFTAFRGFGAPQAMFVLEAAIHQAARKLGLEPSEIQRRNLLREGDHFHYGQKARNCHAERCFDEAIRKYDLKAARERIQAYNEDNTLSKKGLALMPVCFGISFTSVHLNQAGALVHIYTDGSVSVSTGAVEMGQGVNSKILVVVSKTLGIPLHRVRVESTCTQRVANTSPTAASTGADLNGKAAELACLDLRKRLLQLAGKILGSGQERILDLHDDAVRIDGGKTDLTWEKLIQSAYMQRINLSAQAHYATPGIHFDSRREKGDPFAYHVTGTAIIESTVDGLRGTAQVDSVKVVHDIGNSIHPLVDRGQVEGAIVQGLGWVTIEELVYSERGELLTDTLSGYKIPDIRSAPEKIELLFLENAPNPRAVMNSKGVGEPPLMYGIAAYFSILDALKAFHPSRDLPYSAPMTNEKILLWLARG